jgi:flavin reductase (DIM6/NTAB) family NADH-FMN oxidoreductase RutF/rubredoxin
MVDFNALYKITYGLYIVSSGDGAKGNGFISNTVFQVTSEPAMFAACCNKNNYTSQLIEKTGRFAVSVLHQKTDSELLSKFGYKSGKDFNKLKGMQFKQGISGVPIILDSCIAYLECSVSQKIDLGTHWLFIGSLIDAQLVDESKDPLTYAYYRQIIKGLAPKNAPTYIDPSKFKAKESSSKSRIHKCTLCGHIHDDSIEEVKFDDLPDNWVCPLCSAEKEFFTEI